jgi:hypothetical protein
MNIIIIKVLHFKIRNMNKNIMLLSALLAASVVTDAQSLPTTVTYNNTMQPALTLELQNSVEMTEGTILQKLKQTGYDPNTKGHLFWKKNKKEGFYVFDGVALPDLDNQKLDMYFKVVPKSKEDKASSVIYLMISKGYDNFVSPEGDAALWNSAQSFLNSFVDRTTAFTLETDIKSQEKAVKESESRLVKYQEDEKELNSKMEKLQQEIADNHLNQQKQQTDIEGQRRKLEQMKSTRQ